MKNMIAYNKDNATLVCYITPEMFDPDSPSRGYLREQGLDLQNDDAVRQYIKASQEIPMDKHIELDDAEPLPSDMYYCDAWVIQDQKVTINMERARLVHMDKLRLMRKDKFIELGFPYKLNESVENAVVDAATKEKLQELRDIPQTYDLSGANTIDELKAMIPDVLK